MHAEMSLISIIQRGICGPVSGHRSSCREMREISSLEYLLGRL